MDVSVRIGAFGLPNDGQAHLFQLVANERVFNYVNISISYTDGFISC